MAEGAFIASLLAAILPLGAVYPSPLLVSTTLAGFSLTLGALLYRPRSLWILWLAGIATTTAILCAGYVVLQSYCPAPPDWASRFWLLLAPLGGASCPAVSAIGSASLLFLPQLLEPIALFIAGLMIFSHPSATRRLLGAVTVIGVIFAVVGIVNLLAFPNALLLFQKTAYLDSLTGFLVNRNSAATFLGVALIVALVWTVTNADHGPGLGPLILPGVMVLLITTALVLTRSRAGVASTVLGVSILLALNAPKLIRVLASRLHIPVRWAVWTLAFLVVVSLYAIGNAMLSRLALGINDDPRVCIYAAVARGIRSGWPLGHGLGSFAVTFPTFRPPECGIQGTWEMAHNVYLEGAYSMGMFGVALTAVTIGLVATPAIAHLFVADGRRLAATAVLGLSTLVIVHSAADFSIQIPGVAAYVVAAIVALLSFLASPDNR